MAIQDYLSTIKPVWCPGCGDYGILAAFTEAISELKIKTKDLVVVSGIGCSSRTPFFLKSYGFHGVHGRAVPTAQGIQMANPKLEVVVMTGDGDSLAIGGGHLIHAARNNANLTVILFNNAIYGLTKGQVSPATRELMFTKTTPYGLMGENINPTALMIEYEASFVARGFAAEKNELKEIIKAGLKHKGFAFIEVLTTCVSFNPQERKVEKIREKRIYLPRNFKRKDKLKSLKMAESEEPIYLGIFRKVRKETIEEKMQRVIKQTKEEKMTIAKFLSKY